MINIFDRCKFRWEIYQFTFYSVDEYDYQDETYWDIPTFGKASWTYAAYVVHVCCICRICCRLCICRICRICCICRIWIKKSVGWSSFPLISATLRGIKNVNWAKKFTNRKISTTLPRNPLNHNLVQTSRKTGTNHMARRVGTIGELVQPKKLKIAYM